MTRSKIRSPDAPSPSAFKTVVEVSPQSASHTRAGADLVAISMVGGQRRSTGGVNR